MKDIRNFCIIAHIDHGKSTISDRMLEITETIDKRINASSENQFSLQMEVGKTNLPDFLRPKLSELPGKLLQWTLKGEWYVEVDGKTEVWETKSYLLTYNQVIERHYFVERRGY